MTTTIRAILHVCGVAIASALAGCGTLEIAEKTVEQTHAARQAPPATPFRTITGFSSALRCMDNLLIDYGVRDVSTLVEDILDQTKKVNAGTRDMLISAMSDMTRRSRAIRVVAFARDTTNAISFLSSAQRAGAYQAIPRYDIKGSVSQFDDNLVRNQKDLGVGFQPFVNLGISADATTSVLGLDLSVLSTADLSVLSGVTSRNSVVILKTGKGADADAAYHKFGLSFSMSLSKSEGQSQALRGLVELAVIELIGKLTKTPYWSCLGADPKTNEDIRHEMSDWFYAMAASRVELIAYYQIQLRHRGFYRGPIDGEFNPAIDEAIGNYRAALGLENKALLDEAFFVAFLNADHSKVQRPPQPAIFESVAAQAAVSAPMQSASAALGLTRSQPLAVAAPAASAAGRPVQVKVNLVGAAGKLARGQAFGVRIAVDRDAHVYCYLQDEREQLVRFFPNRFSRDSLVRAGRPLSLPGQSGFEFVANMKGVDETVTCYAAEHELLAKLPAAVAGKDLEPLAAGSIDALRDAFIRTAGTSIGEAQLRIEIQ